MISFLSVFCFLMILKDAFETYLAVANYRYQRSHDRSEKAAKTLKIDDETLEKSLAYGKDCYYFSLIQRWTSSVAFLAFLLGGGFAYIEQLAARTTESLGWASANYIAEGIIFFLIIILISTVASIFFSIYLTFVIEQKHGFNRQTPKIFLLDFAKNLTLTLILGGAIYALSIWLVASFVHWWFWLWVLNIGLGIFFAWFGASLILPLFYKINPLDSEHELSDGINQLAQRAGFNHSGTYVMKSSIKSTHGNALFTGIFNKKKIIFYDSLIDLLSPSQVLAVMAHELGHFKLNHVRWGMITKALTNLGLYGLLFVLLTQPGLYESFGFSSAKPYLTLLLLGFFQSLTGIVLSPFLSYLSRKHEFEADAYAVDLVANKTDLSDALVNINTHSKQIPVTHPLYSLVYLSHPPLNERLEAMNAL